ncbi:MAG: radical SAM protein [Thermoleophilia bacterium]|nr:radical SAM protein [Thermoleophilia bacterium]
MKIMLISGAITGEERYGNLEDVGAYLPPYGLMCLAAVLEKEGHEAKILDSARYALSHEQISQEVKDFNPDLIGMSVYSIGANRAIENAKHLKSRFDIPIVAGGPHIIVYPDDLAEFDFFDFLVTGEGEKTLVELVEALEGKRGLADVKGIYYRDNGGIVKNEPRMYIQDLDELPFPAFHLIDDLKGYTPQLLVYRKRPVVTLITSRGCPFECIFCNSVWTRRWRGNSAEYVVDLVEHVIEKYGAREISFHEDTFALNKRRVLEICRLMKERGIDIVWSATVNLKTLDRETILAMKDTGCWLVSVGIESGNDEVLKFIKKPVDKELVSRVTGWLDEAGIKIRGYFMMGHLIDTEETIQETIDFAKSLPLYSMNLSVMYLAPGSEAREIASMYGTVNEGLDLGSGYPRDDLGFVPNGLTKDYIQRMQKKAISEFFFRPSQIFRLMTAVESLEDVKRYARMAKAFVRLTANRISVGLQGKTESN